MRTCPKCSYVRRPTDVAPAWQCPRCGVAYDKVITSSALASRTRERADRQLRSDRSRQPWGVWPWLFLLLAAGSLAWWGYARWRAAHPTAADRVAAAQAESRLAQIDDARRQLDLAADLKSAADHLRMARPQQGMEILQRRADEGHPDAMMALAVAYEGFGHAPRDPAKAREWMQRAAQAGSLQAYVHLGYANETGRGALQNFDEAANQYRKAGRQGDASGLYALGIIYAHGVPGIPPEPMTAYALLELAARAYDRNPGFGDFDVTAKSAHSARYEANQLAKTMSPADVERANLQADAWKPGQPLPFN